MVMPVTKPFRVGDLVWAKMDGLTFKWPGVVSEIKVEHSTTSYLVYFYHGTITHSWVSHTEVQPLGTEKDVLNTASPCETLDDKFSLAVALSIKSRRNNRNSRINSAKCSTNEIRYFKKSPILSLPDIAKSISRKRSMETSDDIQLSLSNDRTPLSKIPRQTKNFYKTLYKNFIICSKEMVRECFPEYSDKEVLGYLKMQWAVMTRKEKSTYFETNVSSEKSDFDFSELTSALCPRERRSNTSLLENVPQLENLPDSSKCGTSAQNQCSSKVINVLSSTASASIVEGTAPLLTQEDVIFQANADEHLLKPKDCTGSLAAMKEYVCHRCEEAGELLLCESPKCNGAFHLRCIGISKVPAGKFLCNLCVSQTHVCLICRKNAPKKLELCTFKSCGERYHLNCLGSKYRKDSKSRFVCPRHYCTACLPDKNAFFGRMSRCVRCPRTYHETCIPTGCTKISPNSIRCWQHHKDTSSTHISWCWKCGKGGCLVCCDVCPRAFHSKCIDLDEVPEGFWQCSNCEQSWPGRDGCVVWARLGNRRWWPAQIECSNNVGYTSVRLFGSHRLISISVSCIVPFFEDDFCSQMFKIDVDSLLEATVRWRELADRKNGKIPHKPPPFKFITSNRPIGDARSFYSSPDLDTIPSCMCKFSDSDPCGPNSNCLNRLLSMECHSKICKATTRCNNQRFQHAQNAPFEVCWFGRRGWGLKASAKILQGEFIIEYCGDVVDWVEYERRLKQQNLAGDYNFYFCVLDKDRVIDAGPSGNYARFMNHSCNPNCETQKWTVAGDDRIGLFSIRDIDVNEELTFDYNMDCPGNMQLRCFCGDEDCRKLIGTKPLVRKCHLCNKTNGKLYNCAISDCQVTCHRRCGNSVSKDKILCPSHCVICEASQVTKCKRCSFAVCKQHQRGRLFTAKNHHFCQKHYKPACKRKHNRGNSS